VIDSSQGNNNYFSQRKVNEHIDNYGIKIDHHLTSKDNLTGRYNHQNLTNLRDNFFSTVPAGFENVVDTGNRRQVVVAETHQFSPTMLNEFRFGFTKIDIGILNCGVGGACGISPTFGSDVGIPNNNNGTFEQSGSPLIGGFGNGFVEFA